MVLAGRFQREGNALLQLAGSVSQDFMMGLQLLQPTSGLKIGQFDLSDVASSRSESEATRSDFSSQYSGEAEVDCEPSCLGITGVQMSALTVAGVVQFILVCLLWYTCTFSEGEVTHSWASSSLLVPNTLARHLVAPFLVQLSVLSMACNLLAQQVKLQLSNRKMQSSCWRCLESQE